MAYRYVIRKNDDHLAHSGKKGMKWGYNDGSRNGRRTAEEIDTLKNKMQEMSKKDNSISVGKDVQGDYDEANNMLKYLGITLDMQSDDEAVVKTMQVYKSMKDSKDSYDNQYDWLKSFSEKLSDIGYDMTKVDEFLDTKKDDINKIKTGSGTGDRSKSNADWKENDKQEESSKKKKTRKRTTKTNKTSTEKSSGLKHCNIVYTDDELSHHGILGMKWGVRRYQNPDGSLTDEGRNRYGVGTIYEYKQLKKQEKKERKQEHRYKIERKKQIKAERKREHEYKVARKNEIKAYKKAEKERKEQLRDEEKSAKRFKRFAIGAAILTSVLGGTKMLKAFTKNPVQFKKDMKKIGDKTLSSIGNTTLKAGEAMMGAAISTVGAIAIEKLAKSLGGNKTDAGRIAFEAGKAGINSVTNSAKSSLSGNKNQNQNQNQNQNDNNSNNKNQSQKQSGTYNTYNTYHTTNTTTNTNNNYYSNNKSNTSRSNNNESEYYDSYYDPYTGSYKAYPTPHKYRIARR